MAEQARFFAGKKFMWDGISYSSAQEATDKKQSYESDGFETVLLTEDDVHLVYTRRVVTEIVVEGAPPA